MNEGQRAAWEIFRQQRKEFILEMKKHGASDANIVHYLVNNRTNFLALIKATIEGTYP